jgi:NOL1/NOP2/fmu family ribosome biogenesis protein
MIRSARALELTFLLHYREGIKTAESKNKQLRESFQSKLELAQQNHDNMLKVLQEQLEKLQQSQKEVQRRDQVSRSKVSSGSPHFAMTLCTFGTKEFKL